jgi:hypothetical protein
VLHRTETTKSLSTGFGTGVAIFGSFIALYGGYHFVSTARALTNDTVARPSQLIATISAVAVALVGIAVGVGLVAFK